jgi:hypothetical protein
MDPLHWVAKMLQAMAGEQEIVGIIFDVYHVLGVAVLPIPGSQGGDSRKERGIKRQGVRLPTYIQAASDKIFTDKIAIR